jgi:hypothetical protein
MVFICLLGFGGSLDSSSAIGFLVAPRHQQTFDSVLTAIGLSGQRLRQTQRLELLLVYCEFIIYSNTMRARVIIRFLIQWKAELRAL